MPSNLFAPSSQSDIRVGYIDPQLGYITNVTICEANDYALANPGTTFLFKNGNDVLQYLNINEVNQLSSVDLETNINCEGVNQKKSCNNPPSIQFYGGGGIGAQANPIVGLDGSLLAVDLVRGGNGYQYPPQVAANDHCNIGSGAVLKSVLGVISEGEETYEGEEDFEEYETCDPAEVGYGKRYGPNGEDLGPWEPSAYTKIGGDPIKREIEKYEKAARAAARAPFWDTRKNRPSKITTNDPTLNISQVYNVTFDSALWSEFMNKYAISPIAPSNVKGSDYAAVTFSMEWNEDFPTTGEYIFRGLCDNVGSLYLDGEKLIDLGNFAGPVSDFTKTVNEGVHTIKVDLLNATVYETVTQTFTSQNYIDVTFTIFGSGGKTSKMSFAFSSEDGSHAFVLPGNKKDKTTTTTTVKVKPNTNYKVVGSSTEGSTEQGLIKNGTKDKEGPVGTSKKVFADRIKSANDNDDMQVTAGSGIFTSSNRRKKGDTGRNTYDLSFRLDSSTSASQTTYNAIRVKSSKSWYENPLGVSVTIDSPEPTVPQEPIPDQEGRCPNNPIWSTRFPSSTEPWYPVRYPGPRTITEIVKTTSVVPTAAAETKTVEFFISSNINKRKENKLDPSAYQILGFTFTAIDGLDSFVLQGLSITKTSASQKVTIRTNVNYIVTPIGSSTKFSSVQQGMIVEGTRSTVDEVGTSNKIFADYVGSINDKDDIQVVTTLGTFTSSNKRITQAGSKLYTYDLVYVLEASPGTKNETTYTTRTYDAPGWSKFMSRYAISPVKPLDTYGSDKSGSTYSTSWDVIIPYDGFYGIKGTRDNNGRILIDGTEVSTLDTFSEQYPKLTKWFLTKGTHTITAEVSNEAIEVQQTVEQKIFRTKDWQVASSAAPITVPIAFTIYGEGKDCKKMSFTFTAEDQSDSFVLKGSESSKKSRTETINVKPNIKYKVVGSSTKGSIEQGLIKNGTKAKETGVGTGTKIFADRIDSANDNDDMQITAGSGTFTSSNKRKKNGRNTYDLTFEIASAPSTPPLSDSSSKDGVVYQGPSLFHATYSGWGEFMNNHSVSPATPPYVGTKTYTWKNVKFPETGQYDVAFQADNTASLSIDGEKLLFTRSYTGSPGFESITVSEGTHDISIEVDNISGNDNSFETNPTGFGVVIKKNVISSQSSSWAKNPMGISAILIPPPCPKKISGRGVVVDVTVEDPGNDYFFTPILTPIGAGVTLQPSTNNIPFSPPEGGIVSVGGSGGTLVTAGGYSLTVGGPPGGLPVTIGGTGGIPVGAGGTPIDSTRSIIAGGQGGIPLIINGLPVTAGGPSGGTPLIYNPTNGVGEPATITGIPITSTSITVNGIPVTAGSIPLTIGGSGLPGIGERNRGTSITERMPGGGNRVTPLTAGGIPVGAGGTGGTPLTLGGTGGTPVTVGGNPVTVNGTQVTIGGDGGIPVTVGGIPLTAGAIGGTPAVVGDNGVFDSGGQPIPFIPFVTPGTYPVTLRIKDVLISNPGINYSPDDEIVINGGTGSGKGNDTGAVLKPVIGPFGKVIGVNILNPGLGFTTYPEISIKTKTGINASFLPQFEVIRDAIVSPEKLIQVTDLVGLKQNGYIGGRAYYGAVFYKDGIRYAGFYETAGQLVQVYDTLQESILATVTATPNAIQRSGTDTELSSNNPKLNIPRTPEDLV